MLKGPSIFATIAKTQITILMLGLSHRELPIERARSISTEDKYLKRIEDIYQNCSRSIKRPSLIWTLFLTWLTRSSNRNILDWTCRRDLRVCFRPLRMGRRNLYLRNSMASPWMWKMRLIIGRLWSMLWRISFPAAAVGHSLRLPLSSTNPPSTLHFHPRISLIVIPRMEGVREDGSQGHFRTLLTKVSTESPTTLIRLLRVLARILWMMIRWNPGNSSTTRIFLVRTARLLSSLFQTTVLHLLPFSSVEDQSGCITEEELSLRELKQKRGG